MKEEKITSQVGEVAGHKSQSELLVPGEIVLGEWKEIVSVCRLLFVYCVLHDINTLLRFYLTSLTKKVYMALLNTLIIIILFIGLSLQGQFIAGMKFCLKKMAKSYS